VVRKQSFEGLPEFTESATLHSLLRRVLTMLPGRWTGTLRAGICLIASCMIYSNVRLVLTARRCGRWVEGMHQNAAKRSCSGCFNALN
jgi:hypothetical protein